MSTTKHADRESNEGSHRAPRVAIAVLTLLLFLVLTVLGVSLFFGQGPSPTPAASSPSPNITVTAAPTTTSATPPPPPKSLLPPAATPRELIIETADIVVPILPLMPTEADLAAQSIVPPETIDGYWLANFGMPGAGSDNTVYITGHSWEGRDSPFNQLSTEVEVGDTVTLTTDKGKIEYVVDSVTTHNKDTLKDSDIWNITPNRLVLISCFTEDLWGKNVIVTATPTS